MADDTPDLRTQLEGTELPEAMVASAQLVALLKRYTENQPIPQTREESLRIQSEIGGTHLASHLEVLANLGDIDRQLRQIGEMLKALREQQA